MYILHCQYTRRHSANNGNPHIKNPETSRIKIYILLVNPWFCFGFQKLKRDYRSTSKPMTSNKKILFDVNDRNRNFSVPTISRHLLSTNQIWRHLRAVTRDFQFLDPQVWGNLAHSGKRLRHPSFFKLVCLRKKRYRKWLMLLCHGPNVTLTSFF